MLFDLSKTFKNIQSITASLVLDLKIYSLVDPKVVCEHVSKELG